MIKPPQNTWKLEMTQKNNQLMSRPQKISIKNSLPPPPQKKKINKKNSDFFLKTPRNTDLKNFDLKKISQAYVYINYQSTPPPPGEFF